MDTGSAQKNASKQKLGAGHDRNAIGNGSNAICVGDRFDRDEHTDMGIKLMIRATVLVCALAFGTGLHGITLAGQPGSDWMPVEKVKEKLMSSGYTSIIKIDADDGHWDGEGIKNGKVMEFDLDPKTGEVLGEVEK